MIKKNHRYICRLALFGLLAMLASCGGGVATPQTEWAGDTLPVRHSDLLQMVQCDGFLVAEIKNPWQGGLLRRYLLVPEGSKLPAQMPEGTILRTPLRKTLVSSGIHAALFSQLGAEGAVGGVCDAKYMLLPWLQRAVAAGGVADCGSSVNVDVEKVAQLSPDAVLLFPFENGGHGKVEKMKYPIVECAEYLERSPLGAAEWMRFYGRLVGRAAVADSLFDAVCKRFGELQALVAGCDTLPTLMCELKSSSAWYVPTGESTMGQMYRVAGADYLFADKRGAGSVPLSYETVLARASDADFWLLKYNSPVDKSLRSLLAEFGGYAHFRPFKEGRVYGCNTAERAFYEDLSFRPDLLLAELVAIFHPSLLNDYKPKYYERLQ